MRIHRRHRLTPLQVLVDMLGYLLIMAGLAGLITELIGYARAVLFVYGDMPAPGRYRVSLTVGMDVPALGQLAA